MFGHVTADFYINVMYGPEHITAEEMVTVNQGMRVSVQCSASGNPPPTITWTRREAIYNSTSTPLASGVGVAHLVVEDARWRDTGVYLCHAANLVTRPPPATTKFIVTQPATEAAGGDGGDGSWAAVGGNGRLACQVRAAPPPTFRWVKGSGETLKTSDKYIIHRPKLQDGLVEWASVLEVRQVTQRDYGEYLCTAHNHLGATSLTRTLSPPTRPHPPLNLTVSNASSTTITLSWSPNYAGGLPRGYSVRYRAAGSTLYQVVEVSGGASHGVTVAGLSPGTQYLFTVQAHNPQGHSSYVTPQVAATTRGAAGQLSVTGGSSVGGSRTQVTGVGGSSSPPSRLPRLMVLLVTLSGAALLALNVAIVGCFVRRRALNRGTSASSSTKNVAVDVYGVTPASTPGLHHSDNHLSLTTMTPSLHPSTPPPYQDDQQTSLDDLDTKATTHDPTPRLNGVLVGQRGGVGDANTTTTTTSSTTTNTIFSSSMSPGSVKRMAGARNHSPSVTTTITTSTAPSTGGVTGGVTGGGVGITRSPRGSPLPQRTTSEDSTSTIASSTYDTPQHHQHTQHHQQNSDQVSLASFHSDYSRGYEYSHPHLQHYHPLCPHHHHTQHHHHHHHHPQTAYAPALYQTQTPTPPPSADSQVLRSQASRDRQGGVQGAAQTPPAYTGLNPSGLCNLRAQEHDVTTTTATTTVSSMSQQQQQPSPLSLLPGSPATYATLGPRKRKPTPSKFASLPRPRPSNAPAHAHTPRPPQPDAAPTQSEVVEGVRRGSLQSFHVPSHGTAQSQAQHTPHMKESTPHAHTSHPQTQIYTHTNLQTQVYAHTNPQTQVYTGTHPQSQSHAHTHPHTYTHAFTNPHMHSNAQAHARRDSQSYTQVLPSPQTRVSQPQEGTNPQGGNPSAQISLHRPHDPQPDPNKSHHAHTPTQHQDTPAQRLQRSSSVSQYTTNSPTRKESPVQRTQSPIQHTHSQTQRTQSPVQRTQQTILRTNSLTRRSPDVNVSTQHHQHQQQHQHHHYKNVPSKASRSTAQDANAINVTTTPTTPTTTTPTTTPDVSSSRPRFPYDFVRQSSLRSKAERAKEGKENGEHADSSANQR